MRLHFLELQVAKRCAIRRYVGRNVDLFNTRCDMAKLIVRESLKAARQVEEGVRTASAGEVKSKLGHSCEAIEQGTR